MSRMPVVAKAHGPILNLIFTNWPLARSAATGYNRIPPEQIAVSAARVTSPTLVAPFHRKVPCMAVVRQLSPIECDMLAAFLQPRLVSSMFLVSNMSAAGLMDTRQGHAGAYSGLVWDRALQGVAAKYWNGNLRVRALCATGGLGRRTSP
jgi:hypothetical protein